MKLTRLSALGLLAAAPLALAGCDDAAAPGGVASGEPLPAVAAPEGTSWANTVTVTPEGGYMIGNPDAPLKLVEYASHTCGACANFAATAKPALKEKYIPTGNVSFELRNLVRDPIDLTIATLVRCGAKENMQPLSDQAWASLNDIFAQVDANQALYQSAGSQPVDQRFITIAQSAGLIDYFAARGLSADQSRACLADTEAVEAIAEASQNQAEELGINATPTFLLNGKKLDVNSWDQLEPLLQRAGAR
ncbi:thioredoxin domain-containing protein [Erythrobacter sp. NFXS35]|uniref:thioredoxin domain-containing protein n=1 Tax=Erythrobacter sp. NFXS35 TaxID=2818436 RepID=UPI0032DEA672